MFRLDQAAARALQRAMGELAAASQRVSTAASKAGADVLLAAVQQAVSLTDHSLQDLADLDHPYARRHGSLTLHAGTNGGMIRDGRHQIHTRTGALLRSLKVVPDGKGGYQVEFVNPPTHAVFVLSGTKFLLPRDPMGEVAAGTKVRADINKAAAVAAWKTVVDITRGR